MKLELLTFLAIASPILVSCTSSKLAAPEATETICFNYVNCLTLEEIKIYRGLEQRIERRLARPLSNRSILRRAQSLFVEFQSLETLRPEVRDSLRKRVGELAFSEPDRAPDRLLIFLSSNDLAMRDLALTHLPDFDSSWLDDPRLKQTLIRLLKDVDASAETQAWILWLFYESEGFNLVAEFGTQLASSPDLESGYGAAVVVVEHTDEYEDKDLIREYFRSGSGSLKMVSAQWLAKHDRGSLLQTEVVSFLDEIARDQNVPAWIRGEAIESIDDSPERDQNREVLLDLLHPENWFFGARGNHFRVHSLALVIDALAHLEDPEIRRRLFDLRSELPLLSTGEREYVEWRLDHAVGDGSEIFYGPVEPEIQ